MYNNDDHDYDNDERICRGGASMRAPIISSIRDDSDCCEDNNCLLAEKAAYFCRSIYSLEWKENDSLKRVTKIQKIELLSKITLH